MPAPRRKPCNVKKCDDRAKDGVIADRREISWSWIIIFLGGAVFGNLIANPLADYLFFLRSSSGTPLSPFEQVFYWYYLQALIYLAILIAALVLMRIRKVSADTFRIAFIMFAAFSVLFSVMVLRLDPLVIVLLLIPMALLVVYMFYRIRITDGKKYVEI